MVTRGGGDDVRGAHDGYNCGSMGGGVMILDNALATFTGSWNTGASSADKYGADYRWASTGVSTARAFWTPSITRAGDYEISMWWPAGSNRNPATQVGLLLNGRLFTASLPSPQPSAGKCFSSVPPWAVALSPSARCWCLPCCFYHHFSRCKASQVCFPIYGGRSRWA